MITPPAKPRFRLRNLLLMLLGLALFGSLGTWQLQRSAERRIELDAFATASMAAPAPGLAAVLPPGGLARVRVSGRYAADRQVLLDNMTHEGQRGYHVLTPLYTRTGVILVNRGFVPGGPDRSQLPDLEVSEAEREVTGLAAGYFRPGLRLEAPVAGESWPRRMIYPTAEQLRGLIDDRLPDYQLLLDRSEPDGYQRAWRPYGLSPDRHLAYAVQWYGLAAAAAGIWLAVTFKRRRAGNAE